MPAALHEPFADLGRELKALAADALALAAERTVEVLKTKVYDLYNGDTSALQRQLEKARKRDENNRRKRELVEVRAAELKRYSEGLEAEVARRTEAIKTILDHVTFGFLVVDRALVVQPECTKSCGRLFDASRIEVHHHVTGIRVDGSMHTADVIDTFTVVYGHVTRMEARDAS